MYRTSETEAWRERHSELLREAEQARLARRLISPARPKNRWSVSALALGFLVALALAALMLVGAGPAHASTTFTVTNTFDPETASATRAAPCATRSSPPTTLPTPVVRTSSTSRSLEKGRTPYPRTRLCRP